MKIKAAIFSVALVALGLATARAGFAADGTGDASVAPSGGESGQIDTRMRDLEEKVDSLKEKIFKSKSRLMLLQETILGGVGGGSGLTLVLKNEISGMYRLASATFVLDGKPVYNKVDGDGSLLDKPRIVVFKGDLRPGPHRLSVHLTYIGRSGFFTYLEGYRMRMRDAIAFTVEEGSALQVTALGYGEGGLTARYTDRPEVRFEIGSAEQALEAGEGGQN